MSISRLCCATSVVCWQTAAKLHWTSSLLARKNSCMSLGGGGGYLTDGSCNLLARLGEISGMGGGRRVPQNVKSVSSWPRGPATRCFQVSNAVPPSLDCPLFERFLRTGPGRFRMGDASGGSIHNLPRYPIDQNTREGCGLSNIPCWEMFSSKFRRCWKMIPRFSGSTKCYPCQGLGTFRQRKMAAGKSAPPSGTLLDFLPPRPPQPS